MMPRGGLGSAHGRRHRADEDSNIMATNDSSVVSKRAAEILYYPQPHFLRYFVKKKKVRSPLISRGYWLRMKTIEHSVCHFLDDASQKRKVVINLGAGFDALPFQLLASNPQLCSNTTFMDVDYPELINKKCAMIKETKALLDVLRALSFPSNGDDAVALRSDHYLAAGCDLNTPEQLLKVIKDNFDPARCMFLFVAEVSICYMDTKQANDVISLAASIENGRFCLLEQFLPRGPEYPFAKTMLAHFKKVKGVLKSIERYQSLSDQRRRFQELGWRSVEARSLWQLWSDDRFFSPPVKTDLSSREPFDEWEDLALFASHYCLVMASNESALSSTTNQTIEGHDRQSNEPAELRDSVEQAKRSEAGSLQYRVNVFHSLPTHDDSQGFPQPRRFGAPFQPQESIFSIHGGYVDSGGREVGRTNSTISFTSRDSCRLETEPPKSISQRMCHTVTTLNNDYDCLLIGGRTSPNVALADCWHKTKGRWEQCQNLPLPLYRHAATVAEAPGYGLGVLVFGGRTSENKVSDRWLFWQKERGWIHIERVSHPFTPRFGASVASLPSKRSSGLLIGGLDKGGAVVAESYYWSIEDTKNGIQICLKTLTCPNFEPYHRFGAFLIEGTKGFYLVGGIGPHGIPEERHDIILIYYAEKSAIELTAVRGDLDFGNECLLVGHHVFSHDSGIIVAGGGAVCFSFGAYNNRSILSLHEGDKACRAWTIMTSNDKNPSDDLEAENFQLSKAKGGQSVNSGRSRDKENVAALTCDEQFNIQDLVETSDPYPCVMSGLRLGSCLDKWSTQYLLETVGPNREITVHRASTEHMSFQPKNRNFEYVVCKLKEFINAIEDGGKEYFRALSLDERDTPAKLQEDFPSIASDFELPPQLRLIEEKLHSSVLRISGPVAMWLHYDVMANVLCQIRGRKKLLLFPPSDAKHLDIPAGSSSSNLDVFGPGAFEQEPLVHTHPYKVDLAPGQVLYIPPLWLHAAEPADGISIAVNVFFRGLDKGYAAGRDTYGNRDLQAYEEGRKDVARMVKRFQMLPRQIAQFYLQRLAQEIEQQTAL